MHIQTPKSKMTDPYLPQRVELSEEERFFLDVDSGKIKVKSNEDVLENLAQLLNLK
ncbi:hypothetical protein ACUHGC_08785 [Testudinibacter sp. P27/CKL/0425]